MGSGRGAARRMGGIRSFPALALILHASDAVRTPGEVVRFGFPYQSCKANGFEDDLSSSRTLDLGAGGGCEDGPFGNHLGVVLNTSGADPYRPLQSTQTNFAAEFTDGFTLELWVKPQKLPLGDTADRVLVSLSAQTSAFTHEQMQNLNCTQPNEVSFQLIMKSSGCLVVHTKLLSTEDCIASDEYERGTGFTIPLRHNAFKLPEDDRCNNAKYASDASTPGLDLTTPKLQHVVVSLSAYMGGSQGPGVDRGGQNDAKRFAVWVDAELKTSDELEYSTNSKFYVYERLFTQAVEEDVCAMKRNATYNLATDLTKNFVPSSIWGTDHTLRIGFDGTADSPKFEGELLMLAMYPRPLTALEVQANYDDKLDNSAPFALDIASVVAEGICSQLVSSFDSSASDWDTLANQEYPSLGTAPSQTLTFYVNSTLHPQNGTLYADAACLTPLAPGPHVGVTSTSLYYKPAGHEFSSGGPAWGRTPPPLGEPAGIYATLPWTVEDGNGGSHGATIRINVSAVNDAPVAADGANDEDIYKGLGAAIFLSGTDMDGLEDLNRLANCRIRIKSTPQRVVDGVLTPTVGGTLHRLTRSTGIGGNDWVQDGTDTLSVGDETTLGSCNAEDSIAECQRDGLGLWYISSSLYPTAEGQETLGVDQFTFSVLDADGAESANNATYSITILSGLRAKLATEDRTCNPADPADCGCDTCTLTAPEEVP